MAKQLLDKTGKLTLEQSIGRFFANEKCSDVCFLIGEQREKLHAHRFLLAIESEVFETMFHGALKETKYEIAVPDDSPVGFRNMLKYFYTKKVEIDLSEIYETYKTADKYAAMDLTHDLADYLVEKCRAIPNVCVIFDQLLKLATLIEGSQISREARESLKFLIGAGFSNACASASFNEISEDTLVAILNFRMLNISELDLLKACFKWIEHQVVSLKLEANQSNKRKIFEPIKRLIRFGDLSVADFSLLHQQHPLGDYLIPEEIGKLFMFLSQPNNPPPIDCHSPRVPAKARVARGCPSYTGLELKITQNHKEISPDAKIVLKQENGHNSWVVDFSQCVFILEPNINYQLYFSLRNKNPNYNYDRRSIGASQDPTLKSEEGEVVLEVHSSSSSNAHCIESIDYWSM